MSTEGIYVEEDRPKWDTCLADGVNRAIKEFESLGLDEIVGGDIHAEAEETYINEQQTV